MDKMLKPIIILNPFLYISHIVFGTEIKESTFRKKTCLDRFNLRKFRWANRGLCIR
jgi:hypothetical protein